MKGWRFDSYKHALAARGIATRGYYSSRYGTQRFAFARREEPVHLRPTPVQLDAIRPGQTVTAVAINKNTGLKDRVDVKVITIRGNRITGELVTYSPAITTTQNKVFLRKGQVLQIR
jgi:hypothetical protein